ncbi:MAG: bifunctional (p)ppGpp synthetase/guanosine-3',5'-bis(diphosphate) 3'-pyrophosphohydrolase, partial [Anaerolineae bacterium]|nr:bifunctional (p)ppGpp synthetase/guanosine-3',5'-bis(diphosphate) 3'-pyrophosphohydrolase [Anaerolineae bacterium]
MVNNEFSESPVSLEELIERLPRTFSEVEIEQIREAYALAEMAHSTQPRASGEPYTVHLLAVAGVLADMRLDSTTIIAGLLHDIVEDTDIPL